LRYLYGPGVDMILARRDGSGTDAWYLPDHLGSVRDIANTSGTILDHIRYSAYGNVTNETQPSNGDRFKFNAREYDAETADYYYRARHYDPAAGRFLSEDWLGLLVDESNLYRYVRNAPLSYVDPIGMDLNFVGGVGTEAEKKADQDEIDRIIAQGEAQSDVFKEMMKEIRGNPDVQVTINLISKGDHDRRRGKLVYLDEFATSELDMKDIRGLPDLPDFKKVPRRGMEAYKLSKQEALMHVLSEQFVARKLVKEKQEIFVRTLGRAHTAAVDKQIEFRKEQGMPRLVSQSHADDLKGVRMTFKDGSRTVITFEDAEFVAQKVWTGANVPPVPGKTK
jgi:RHS repeat-associated protein